MTGSNGHWMGYFFGCYASVTGDSTATGVASADLVSL